MCNNSAIRNCLKQRNLGSAVILIIQEFLCDEESVGGSINQNQISGGSLNLYLFIFRRLIFESSVRDGSPSFAAAPAVPETGARPGSGI